MSFIAKMFMPKMPALPSMELPKVENVPNVEDAARKAAAEADERRRMIARTGRSQTILTTSKGLNELSDEEYEQKTLLG